MDFISWVAHGTLSFFIPAHSKTWFSPPSTPLMTSSTRGQLSMLATFLVTNAQTIESTFLINSGLQVILEVTFQYQLVVSELHQLFTDYGTT
jgi:hypothetical protein